MTEFSTCFPINKSISNNDFISLSVSWLNGVKSSKVFKDNLIDELHDDQVTIKTDDGEQLQFKTINCDDYSAIGLQHEIPDVDGRIWRTECVVTRGTNVWVHVRGQCIIANVGAVHMRPKKPYLIKMMLHDGWASIDGNHIIDNRPHKISENEVELAQRIICGTELGTLPQIYVSKDDSDFTIIDEEKLAFEMGGLAHVFIEPSRRFSIGLMKKCEHKNPYGGTIAICIPGIGVIRKFYKRFDGDNQQKIINSMVDIIAQYHTSINRPYALDWKALQELQSRELRKSIGERIKRDQSSSKKEIEEYVSTFDSEISAKNARIAELTNTLNDLISSNSYQPPSGHGILSDEFSRSIGEELYDGEISDRVRIAVKKYLEKEFIEKSKRELYILQKFLELSKPSGRSVGLISEIKSAGRDVNEMPARMGAILSRMGFSRSEEGKHLKFSPPHGLGGIEVVILPKTPSDYRAGKNQASDLIEILCIRELNKE